MLTLVGKILPSKIRQLGLEKDLEFKKLSDEWEKIIARALDEKFQNKTRPLRMNNKFLTVRCRNSVWANEFQMKESLVLKAVKNRFKALALEKIKFLI